MEISALIALPTAALVVTAATSDDALGWQTYTNVRFGFRACYPTKLLKAQREADNSDGRTFHARDGAELRVFGANNLDQESLAQEASNEANFYLGKSGKIAYRVARAGWTVISGDDGKGTDFYTKTFARADRFVAFQIKYPHAQAAHYKPVVEQLNRCFLLLRPGY